MKKLCFIFLMFYCVMAQAQVGGVIISANGRHYVAGPASTITDTAGKIYSHAEWIRLFATGDYAIQFIDSADTGSRFLIIRMTPEQRRAYFSDSPKPRQTNSFDSGGRLPWFKAKDLQGTLVDTRKLAGKILVVNFWFIACKPCVAEIPSLNKLADSFAGDTSIVFLAVALDGKEPLKRFMEKQPLSFRALYNGDGAAQRCNIRAYPTNIVVNRAGEVVYHTHGSGPIADYWLERTILELRQKGYD